jgi:alpha-mannosidase
MRAYPLLLGFALSWTALGLAQATPTVVFRLGERDGLFQEFSRQPVVGAPVVFRAGQDTPQKRWPAYHPGSFDHAVTRSTMERDWTEARPEKANANQDTFTVVFPLASAPKGTFILALDVIVRHRRPAAAKYLVTINGKFAGRFQLNPHPAPELWWPNGGEGDGNLQYFGYESLNLSFPAELFTKGENKVALQLVDGFGIYYDALALLNDPRKTPPTAQALLTPTVLYKRKPTGLVELAELRLRTTKPVGSATLTMAIGSVRITRKILQSEPGDYEVTIEVPEVRDALPARVYLSGVARPIYEGEFVPKRKWKVFALPMEQADFGYNDLPSRTLEWENRFIDKTLEIQRKYPSYSFTLDASANLESYLLTRKQKEATELLDKLRSEKWGINALYANSFTGLAAPEELFRGVEYSLGAAKRHGFTLDSASQTDEPSVSWGVAQVLADAGIKFFANGSDPIRGALNPIGLLNFRSPFYWETPTGSKLLVWSGVSYTAVDDMTWGGWDPESAQTGQYQTSIFGLTRSLPLFLSQYERSDFPFDAVLLFGLHNDEIPMRHWGDADVFEKWNAEYAFPQVVPSTQRDFFQHIRKHFDGKIQTMRGDGGAYWEDEAAADARIAAMIRTAQSQILAAEKFESVANWLKPHLNIDPQPFTSAWKNILLADSYVWSDANSFRRPESYRTRAGEAAHRAWAEAALQQTSDLRLVAMDKVAELLQTNEQGAVVFNSESWERSDFFDFELELDETLVDPTTRQAIPCGTIKSLHDYQHVRCWAARVPAMGYKFYPTAKGKIPEGTPVALDAASPTIENDHYKAVLDKTTGSIRQLVDKNTGRDLVDAKSGYGLNEYLYVTGGDPGTFLKGSLKDNRILSAEITLPLPELDVHRAPSTAPPRALRFPWGTSITVHLKAENTPEVISTITLLDNRKQVNIENTVEKLATLRKEGVYFAFPFALNRPTLKYQSATAWVDPQKDMLPGANVQWFATQGGVWGNDTQNSVALATVDAPLVTFQDINRGIWPKSIDIANGTTFSYVMNNYWHTDTPAQQGGRFTFRYSLTSGPAATEDHAANLAAEQRSPFFAIKRYNMGWQPTLSIKGASFLSATPSSVRVLTVRPLDTPNSYIVRVQNMSSGPVEARLNFPMTTVQNAYIGSVLGERVAATPWDGQGVTVKMGRNEITTVVVTIGATE